jgi:hypothetical protein
MVSDVYVAIILKDLILSVFLGLGFRPSPPIDNVESTLIWYKGTDREQYRHWTDSLEKFLEGKHTLFLIFFCFFTLSAILCIQVWNTVSGAVMISQGKRHAYK